MPCLNELLEKPAQALTKGTIGLLKLNPLITSTTYKQNLTYRYSHTSIIHYQLASFPHLQGGFVQVCYRED